MSLDIGRQRYSNVFYVDALRGYCRLFISEITVQEKKIGLGHQSCVSCQ